MIDAAEPRFSGPVSSRMQAFRVMENVSGLNGARAAMYGAAEDLGGARATYDFLNGTGLAYGLMMENPY
jgi:hypothetical protein